MQIVRMSENSVITEGIIKMGDRILSCFVVQDNYQFGTYDLNDNAPNEISLIPYSTLEGEWHYVYLGYSREKQLANYYEFDGKNHVKHAKNENLLHKPLGDVI